MKPLKRLLVAGLATHPSLRRKLSTCDCTPWWFPNASGFSSDDQKRGSLFFLSVVRNSLTSADGSEVLKLVNQVIEQRSDLLEVQLCEVIDMGGNFLQSFARTLEGVLEMRVSPGTTIACLAFTRFVMEELSTAGHPPSIRLRLAQIAAQVLVSHACFETIKTIETVETIETIEAIETVETSPFTRTRTNPWTILLGIPVVVAGLGILVFQLT